MEISILMVDDDRILVEKLEETVDWKRIGISMVFTANNIRQAQKILEEFPIQILLCDIDMPQGSTGTVGMVTKSGNTNRMYFFKQLCEFCLCTESIAACFQRISVKTHF